MLSRNRTLFTTTIVMADYHNLLHEQVFLIVGGCILSDIIAREGFTKFPNFIFNLGLTPVELTTLIVLYQHCPNVNPSVDRIAKIVGVSQSTINRAFTTLESKNLIGRRYKTGDRTVYLLHKDYKSFITKKLSTSYQPPLSPMTPLPLSNNPPTPVTHDSTPLSPMTPKQEKKQDKEQEIIKNDLVDKSERIKMANEMRLIIKQSQAK